MTSTRQRRRFAVACVAHREWRQAEEVQAFVVELLMEREREECAAGSYVLSTSLVD